MQEHEGSVEEALAVIRTQPTTDRIVDDLLDGASQGAGQLRLEPRGMEPGGPAELLEPRPLHSPGACRGPVNSVWDGGRLIRCSPTCSVTPSSTPRRK